MTYEAFRIAFQDSEQAACAAYRRCVDLTVELAAIKAQEPYLYVYEYDSFMGLHREFRPIEWNGLQPTRTVALYRSPQPSAEGSAEAMRDVARLDWLDDVLSVPGGRRLICFPGKLRAALDEAMEAMGEKS